MNDKYRSKGKDLDDLIDSVCENARASKDGAAKIAAAFREIATQARVIAGVLHTYDTLADSVPANWPLQLSADEFAEECRAMAEHYDAHVESEDYFRYSPIVIFSDGESFETGGPYRIVARRDGLYVVGKGMLVPVDDRDEGEALILDLQSKGK